MHMPWANTWFRPAISAAAMHVVYTIPSPGVPGGMGSIYPGHGKIGTGEGAGRGLGCGAGTGLGLGAGTGLGFGAGVRLGAGLFLGGHSASPWQLVPVQEVHFLGEPLQPRFQQNSPSGSTLPSGLLST